MWIGHYQLGDILPVTVWTTDASETPTEPDDVPVVHVYDASGVPAKTRSLPIIDRNHVTGYFHYRMNLDEHFSTGYYTIHVNYQISSSHFAKFQQFEVLAGGNDQGNGIAMHFFRQAAADYVLLQVDQGDLKRLRNPNVRSV